MDGQWEFYWNRFIVTEPEKLPKPNLIISVPDSWSNYRIDGERLPSEGYGSYKLTLTGLTYENTITLHIPDFGGAYRVFIDGQLVSESGKVSKDKDELFIVPKADLYPVTLSTGMKHEAVIEVATTRFSGLYMTPIMGDFHKTVNDNNGFSGARSLL